jgi:hypothetical protein
MILNSSKKINQRLINESDIGFFYSVFNEEEAVDFSIKNLKVHYPDSFVYLVSDGGADFSYLESRYSKLKTSFEQDTMSRTFEINKNNFQKPAYDLVTEVCVKTLLNRLTKAIDYLGTDYVVMLDPDALVRGRLSIPYGSRLLGSRVNRGFPRKFRKIMRNFPGGISINYWGATPAIFEVKTFLRAKDNLLKNWHVFEELRMHFHALYAHDVILPVIFGLIGIKEEFNPDITECLRDKDWKLNKKPLVHQFREYYPKKH